MKLSLGYPPKLVENLDWSQLFRFVKFSFPVMHLMPYYVKTDRSHPPNRRTLPITLIGPNFGDLI